MGRLLVIVALGWLLTACTLSGGSGRNDPREGLALPSVAEDAFDAAVLRVVDGDTMVADRGGRRVRVRLIGIDAPESVQPGGGVECFGHEAASHLRSLVPKGTRLRASYQSVDRADRQDRFGRELWDVWLPNGAFLQSEIVLAGFARARAYPPHVRYADVLAAAEEAAALGDAGMHGACSTSSAR